MHRLFIYGTLKRGFPNFATHMQKALYIGRFQTVRAYPLIVGGKWFSVCLIDEPGQGHRVIGELFKVSDEDLKLLDQLEATHRSDGYRRIRIEVHEIGSQQTLEAWCYLKDRDLIDPIHSAPMREYQRDPRYIEVDKRCS